MTNDAPMSPDTQKRSWYSRTDPADQKWGTAHPERGGTYREYAIAFIRTYKIGTSITTADFDAWAEGQGLLPTVPPRDPKSDAWIAHLKRRSEVLQGLNRAGPHPAIAEAGETPFVIEVRNNGEYEVMAPRDSINERTILRRVSSLMRTKRRQLAWLMQGEEWGKFEPYEVLLAEAIYDDINFAERLLTAHLDALDDKFNRLGAKLRRGVQDGRLRLSSPEVQSLLDLQAPTEEDEPPAIEAS